MPATDSVPVTVGLVTKVPQSVANSVVPDEPELALCVEFAPPESFVLLVAVTPFVPPVAEATDFVPPAPTFEDTPPVSSILPPVEVTSLPFELRLPPVASADEPVAAVKSFAPPPDVRTSVTVLALELPPAPRVESSLDASCDAQPGNPLTKQINSQPNDEHRVHERPRMRQ